tara:strand:- start:2216 stop:3382 length:1167 start_codon:yes stop_codon:yes gene_type:complete
MATLTSQSIKDTYKDMVHLYDATSATGQGFESSLKTLYDGEGIAGPVKMSSTTFNVPVGKTLSVDGSLSGAVFTDVGLPSQSGNSGKFLTTNGSVSSWDDVDALPSQTGNSGKFLITNGSATSWETIDSEITSVGTLTGATPLVFEGATPNDFETTFAITDPTADRTITFPDASGTVTMEPASGSYVVHNSQVDINILTDYQSGKQLQYNGTEVAKVGHTHSYAAQGTNADITSLTGLALTALIVEGTDDAFETSLKFTDPTAARNIVFPDASGTVLTTGNLTSINGTLGATLTATTDFRSPEYKLWGGSLNYYSGMSYNGANVVKLGKTDTGTSSDHCDVLIDTGTTLVVKGVIKQSAIANPASPPTVQEGGTYSDGENLYFGSTTT